MRSRRPRPAPPSDQRGQALILTALLIIIGVGALLFRTTTLVSNSLANQQTKNTERALTQVKEALIGWSASRTPVPASLTIRPGELPCPDMNNNGLDDDGSCAAGAIGRVPWKTLGVPELKDSAGETLWYAIAGPFRYKNVNPQPITSDTLGNLIVYQDTSATVMTSQAIAVLFAPGPALGAQTRGSTTALCSTTGTTIPSQNCAANYLETTGGANNAQTDGPFIGAGASGTFNDRVLAIINADLMPLVEQRVAREMMSLLWRYKNATGVYPWADLYDGDSNGDPNPPSPDANNRARFPCGHALPVDWDDLASPITLPDWLTNGCPDSGTGVVDGWSSLIYYSVAKNRLQNSGNGCSTCSANPLLSVTNTGFAYLCTIAPAPFSCTWSSVPTAPTTAEVILITPGGSDGSPRNWPTRFNLITGYFEDTENSLNNDDNYQIPSSSNPNRDRMFIIR
jgi:hypothetical protein